MNYAIKQYLNDTEGRPDGWPREVRQLAEGDIVLRDGETLFTSAEYEAHVAALSPAMSVWSAARELNAPYVITDLFDRFTMQERITIRALGKENDQIADLWDNLLALREGVECPPDGTTPGRAKAQAAKAACAAIFGQARADVLFAKP